MRLISSVFASVILHALLLQVSISPCLFKQTQKFESRLFQATNQLKTTGLLVTFQSLPSNNELPPSVVQVASNEEASQPIAERVVLEKPMAKQHPSEQKNKNNSFDQSSSESNPRYFSRHEVEYPPRMIDDVNEKGSPLEKALREVEDHGSVILELWINDRGWIDKTEVISSTLPNSVTTIIRNNIELTRSIPARLNDRNVPCKIRIEYEIREKPDKRE